MLHKQVILNLVKLDEDIWIVLLDDIRHIARSFSALKGLLLL